MGVGCVGKEQERISARRGSMCKGMTQHDLLKNLRSLGARKARLEMELNSLARLGLALLWNLGFSPTRVRAAPPDESSRQAMI